MKTAIALFISAIFLCSATHGMSQKKSHPPITKWFKRAQNFYDKQKYSDALIEYSEILKVYPGHTASFIQYAKTFYKLKRIREAYAVFARINPNLLDSETSYEYGMCFYQHKQYQGALFAFKRVPNGHPLYDLSNYYAGVSALKLKKWEESLQHFDNSLILPRKLAKSKNLYQSKLENIIRKQEASQLDEEAKKLSKPKKLSQKSKKPTPIVKKIDDNKSGFFSALNGQSASYYDSSTNSEYETSKVSKSTLRTISINQNFSPNFKSESKSFPKHNRIFGVQFFISGAQDKTTGSQKFIGRFEETPEVLREISKTEADTTTLSGTISVAPFFETPVAKHTWFGIKLEGQGYYPSVETANKTQYAMIASHIGRINDDVKDKADFELQKYFQSDGLETHSKGKFSISRTQKFDTLSTGVSISYDFYSYTEPSANDNILEISGPDSITSLEGVLSESFPFKFTISGKVKFSNISNELNKSLPNFTEGAADGTRTLVNGSIANSYFSWLSVAYSYTLESTNWTVLSDNQELVNDWENNVPNQISRNELTALIFLNF